MKARYPAFLTLRLCESFASLRETRPHVSFSQRRKGLAKAHRNHSHSFTRHVFSFSTNLSRIDAASVPMTTI